MVKRRDCCYNESGYTGSDQQTDLKGRLMKIKTRILSVLLILVLTMGTGMTAAATETDGGESEEQESSEEELSEEELEEQRKEEERQEAYDMPVQSNEIAGWPKGPGSYAQSAIVMEVGTGAILYAKNIDDPHYPASITKLLTALVALENGDLSDPVVFSHDCVAFLEPGDSSIGLQEGDQITLEQALYAMLLASANEAAYAVAENVGKNAGYDYDWFIQKMNEKCEELGCQNSHFVNTNGLHDDEHYTSARDMALISRALFEYPEFFEIVQTLEYTIPESDTVEEHVFQQKHKMLQPWDSNYYAYAIGGKTGYTTTAGTTLVTMADNGTTQLICVLLQTFPGYAYPDTEELFEYGFSHFTKTAVAGLEQSEDFEEIEPVYEEDGTGYVMLPEGVEFSDLDLEITRDEGIGNREATLTYTYEGNLVGTARATLSDAYLEGQTVQISSDADEAGAADEKTRAEQEDAGTGVLQRLLQNPAVLIVCIVLAAAVITLIVALVVVRIRRKRKQRKKQQYTIQGDDKNEDDH